MAKTEKSEESRAIAKMPASQIHELTVEFMKEGDEGYAVPWALSVADNRTCWLRGHWTLRPHSEGTVSMKVTKTATGWAVVVPGSYMWEPTANITADMVVVEHIEVRGS